MKKINFLIVAAVLTVPAVSSFAQSNGPVTRDGVQGQLTQMQQDGANPAINNANTYPTAVQRAESRVAVQDNQTSSYGGVANGLSASGAGNNTQTPGLEPVYFGSR